MKLAFTDSYNKNIKELLRQAGYHPFVDPNTRKQSYVRTLQGGSYYPRFHIYVEIIDGGFQVDLHLDQKKPSYGGKAHAGEYDGPVVEEEGGRISRWMEYARTA